MKLLSRFKSRISSFRLFTWGLVLLSMVALTSCINIEEHYHFNRDGSGKMWIKMDVSDMMAMMGGLLEKTEEAEPLDESELFDNTETVDQLKEIAGISNVKSLSDQDEGIIGYSFDFASTNALNNSLTIVNEDVAALTDQSDSDSNSRNFEYTGKKLVISIPETTDATTPEEEEELDEGMMEMMTEFMKDYTYKTTYSFEQSVKKAKNKNMEVAPDKKSVVIEENMADLMEEGVSLGGTIKLKK